MTGFENLRGNFTHVVRDASLRDLHVMLCVLHDELAPRFAEASLLVGRAADVLNDYLLSKAPRKHARDEGGAA